MNYNTDETVMDLPDGCCCSFASQCSYGMCDMASYTCGAGTAAYYYGTSSCSNMDCMMNPNYERDMDLADGCCCSFKNQCMSMWCDTASYTCSMYMDGATPEDSCQYVGDGACDEPPEQTFCMEGTDCTDCGNCMPSMTECMMMDEVKAPYFDQGTFPGTIASLDGATGIITVDWADGDPAGRESPHYLVMKEGAACMLPI